jgi:hypothetical protein
MLLQRDVGASPTGNAWLRERDLARTQPDCGRVRLDDDPMSLRGFERGLA